MKGQVAAILIILFLVIGALIFLVLSVIFIPLLKSIAVSPSVEQPLVGALTAFLGFLPDHCSSLTSLECKFCLVTEKIVPLVVNMVFGLILFSVILNIVPGIVDWKGGVGVVRGESEFYGLILLMSLSFSIFMLHQPNPLVYLNVWTMLLAISVRIIIFMVTGENDRLKNLRRLTDFFLAANIIVSGWDNLWVFAIVFIAGFTFASAIVRRGGGEGPRMHFTRANMLMLTILLLIAGSYLYAVFEHQAPTPFGKLPTKIEFKGLASYIIEKANLPQLKCGENILGPESSISF